MLRSRRKGGILRLRLARGKSMVLRSCGTAALLLVVPLSANAGFTCADVLKALRKDLVDATCFVSSDLTTANEQTTPLNNSLPGLPAFAFTPRTDRDVISPSAAKRAPITKAVPGAADPGAHRLRPAGAGALPPPAAEGLERPAGGRRCLGHAQRIQRRFRVERPRRAAGLRLCLAEQGRVQPPADDSGRSARLQAQSGFGRSCASTPTIRDRSSRAGPSS